MNSTILALMASVLTLDVASALEIYRNSERYDIEAQLPEGSAFVVAGVDRQFTIDGVRGNLRLIQDHYSECGSLIEERRAARLKDGYALATDEAIGDDECSISLTDELLGVTTSSFYIRLDICQCFAALHFTYSSGNRQIYEREAGAIVASLRSNNGGETPRLEVRAGAAGDGFAERVARAIDSLSCAYEQPTDSAQDKAVIALSAWSGKSAARLASEAGIDDFQRLVGESYSLANIDDGPQIAERMAAASSDTVMQIERDITRFGPSFCPIIASMFRDGLDGLVENQNQFRSPYHGYLHAAQKLSHLNDCGPAETDGAFGPASGAAWNALLQGLGRAGSQAMPLPGELAEIASIPVSSGACEPGRADGAKMAPLRFLAPQFGEGWLDVMDGELTAMMDAFGASGAWTTYQSRLARMLVNAGYDEEPGTRERLLADIYQHGIGVEANADAARHWRSLAAAEPGDYARYLAGLDDEQAAIEAVRLLLSGDEEEFYGGAYQAAGPTRVDYGSTISIAELPGLARASTLVMRYPAALDAVTASGDTSFKIKLADRLLEGAGMEGKGMVQSASLLRSAAADGSAFAASRLAFMHQQGLGVPADKARARQLALDAAKENEPFALYLLARMAEEEGPANFGAALDWYRRLLGNDGDENGMWTPVDLVSNRVMSGSSALSTPAGLELLRRSAERNPFLARGLARLALCTTCGGSVDLADAAQWLRIAHDSGNDPNSGLMLHRLLTRKPELAIRPDEAMSRLAANVAPPEGGAELYGSDTDIGSFLSLSMEQARIDAGDDAVPQKLSEVLQQLCRSDDYGCDEAARMLASGSLDPRLVAPGIDMLEENGSVYLADILATYGDFAGALSVARRFAGTYQLQLILSSAPEGGAANRDFSNNRAATFRRLISRRPSNEMESLPPALEPLLRFLAQRGDVEAAGFLALMQEEAAEPVDIERDVQALGADFEKLRSAGGLSRAFVNASREYSLALEAEGDKEAALRLELTALSTELHLDEIAGLMTGPIQSSLTRACHLSHASERAFELGSDDVAMVLAKDAVNELQRVRRDLSDVPEHLQACFSDLVSDNYRWLADLFIRQDRLSEAEYVLGLLKEFESFQFVERDATFAGRSYQELPYSREERVLKDALQALSPPTVPDARRSEALRAKRAASGLSSAEAAELAEIDLRLAEADAAYEKGMALILDAAEALGRSDRASQLADLGPLQGYMQTDIEAEAAAIHFVVLPDRISAILTTPYDRKSHSVLQWDGEAFSEDRLNVAIDGLHAFLSEPNGDPRPQAKKLYDLLIAPFADDLAANDVELVLLSLDRRLRYLPFGALHDGERFFVEKYELSVLSDAGYEIAGDKVTDVPFAALGMTQAAEGFSALPGVAIELDGIVKGEDGFGLFEGRTALDTAFDRVALEDALRIGSAFPVGVGVVHISSHFSLGDTDATSFLLLGTGEHLSLRDIKQNRRAFEFGRVDLLTLSACSTGYANAGRDGRELESLSRITGERGAKAILASLWPVADKTTAILMQRFYELRERGGYSKAHAMALVQREFIDGEIGSTDNLAQSSIVFETAARGAVSLVSKKAAGNPLGLGHPYYWAPFVLTGNWR